MSAPRQGLSTPHMLGNTPSDAVLRTLDTEIGALPASVVPLVGALVAMQVHLPDWLREALMVKLASRGNLDVVTPSAEAVMRLTAFSEYRQEEFAQAEIACQLAFLRATAMDGKAMMAASFLSRLADLLTTVLTDSLPPVGRTLPDMEELR